MMPACIFLDGLYEFFLQTMHLVNVVVATILISVILAPASAGQSIPALAI